MAARVLLVAKQAEIDALAAAMAGRKDFHPVACPRWAQVVEALEKGPPEIALVRLRLPDADGLEVLRRIRGAAPASSAIMILDAADAALRDACVGAGCEDVVFAPFDAEALVRRLAGADENRLRREPRLAFGASATLELAGVAKDVFVESLSPLGMRIRWSEAPPGRQNARVTLELERGMRRTLWVHIEEPITRKGAPEALLARFIALAPDEEDALRRAVEKLRGERGGPLEAPSGPIVLDRAAPAGDDAVDPPARSGSGEARARLRLTTVVLVASVSIAAATAVRAWRTVRAIRHPELRYAEDPEHVVEGLRIKAVHRLEGRVVARADASWRDLRPEDQSRVVTRLAEVIAVSPPDALEVWTVSGRVATATFDSGGNLSVTTSGR